MRKIGSEKEIEKKKKRNIMVLSILILGILVVSTVGFAFISSPGFSDSTSPENEIPEGTVVNIGNQWAVSIADKTFYFSNSPESVQDIPVEIQATLQSYASKPLYIVSDKETVAREIATTLGRFTARVQEACYGLCDKNLPEKDCTDNLVIYRERAEKRAYQEGNCVFIEGDMFTVDAFLYRLFGLSETTNN